MNSQGTAPHHEIHLAGCFSLRQAVREFYQTAEKAPTIKKGCHTREGGYPNSPKRMKTRFHGNDDPGPKHTFSAAC
jgi:hypothetical protein